MAETIPAVDAAEVAALADAAEAEPVDTRRYTERERPEPHQAADADAMTLPPGIGLRTSQTMPADRAVAAQLALAAEIASMAERLERMDAQMRHTMLLVMVLAERAHVDAGEYDKAKAQMQRADAAAKGHA